MPEITDFDLIFAPEYFLLTDELNERNTGMTEYIFYTTEGFAQDPEGNDVENCQLMGRAYGTDEKEALHNLLAENPWIEEHHFNPEEFICKELAFCQPSERQMK